MRVSRNSKYIIPYLEKFYEVTSYYSYSLIRFVAGAMTVPHGYSKLFVNLNGTVDFFKSVQLEPAYPLAIYIGILEFSGGLFLLSNTVASAYLWIDRMERRGGRSEFAKRLPSLEVLDQLSYRLVAFVFPLWTFAIIAGAIWAEAAWRVS